MIVAGVGLSHYISSQSSVLVVVVGRCDGVLRVVDMNVVQKWWPTHVGVSKWHSRRADGSILHNTSHNLKTE